MKAVAAVLGLTIVSLSGSPGGGGGGDDAFDFQCDVLPFLQRLGCASAYCHGSATGQGGFKLSLFGSDAAADHAAIVTEFGGRRIDLRDADASLLLQKARGGLDHGGGPRLVRGQLADRQLQAWIAAGAPWRSGAAREVTALTLQRDGDRLRATATIAGQAVDVTERSLFRSTDPSIVEVDPEGVVRDVGAGRACAVARFANRTATLVIVRPFAGMPPRGEAPTHALDAAFAAHLRELGLQPVTAASAERLVRRLHLDVVGRPPTPHEIDRFTADPDVERTVRELGRRREFAAVWGEHLARWFEVPATAEASRRQLVDTLARDDRLLVLVQRIADGELPLLQQRPDPRDRAEHAARALLGVRIGCARCHDHPDDRWRQQEHLAFSAAFAPARAGEGGAMTPGVLFDDATGRPVPPRWLALPGSQVKQDATLAGFVTDAGHGQLARHLANRVFAELLGRGLVEPVDDHRASNPPLHEGMLAALAHEFTRVQGRLVDLLVFVTTSRPYALGLVARDDVRGRWLAGRRPVPLAPAAFARAVGAVVGRDPVGELPAAPLPRELELRNGAFLGVVAAGGSTTVDALFEFGGGAPERLEELWRTVLSRRPRDDEVAEFLPAAAGLPSFRELAIALLSGREFGERR